MSIVLETVSSKTFEKEALSSIEFKNSSPDLFFKRTHCPVTFGTEIRALTRNGLTNSSMFCCSVKIVFSFAKIVLLKKHSGHIIRFLSKNILCSSNALASQVLAVTKLCICWSTCGYYFWLSFECTISIETMWCPPELKGEKKEAMYQLLKFRLNWGVAQYRENLHVRFLPFNCESVVFVEKTNS